ncbi:hypothetical protein [Microvirga calopogonii]|uniref:hypothetical protein n=1 Tax=Microvirga calopogonii TaxID=2078013 RepID=UPI000E0DD0BB|nr:hypothetical protein [Microvirga calopogonii]
MAAETRLIPAWRLLNREGLHALVDAPRRGLPEGIFLTPNRALHEINAVPLVMAARQVIERAIAQGGLSLTAAGALSRADTRALFDLIDWPDYTKNEVLAVNQVLNEADALPVHVTRIVLQVAGLLRRRGKVLIAAKKAQALLDPNASADLFALLFETTLWRVSLSYFDRFSVEHWPQDHIGIVLWCLSVAANDWADADLLAQVCTVRDERLDRTARDLSGPAMRSRILRPLTWFGLMEMVRRGDEVQADWMRPILFRKTALFDAVVGFKIEVPVPTSAVH